MPGLAVDMPVTDPSLSAAVSSTDVPINAVPINSVPINAVASRILKPAQWLPLQEQHAARVDVLTEQHRIRAGVGRPHPVEDFLFTYYSLRPAQLRRWYPGFGVGLAGADERSDWRFHRRVEIPGLDGAVVVVDLPAFLRDRGKQLAFTTTLLSRTSAAPGQFGCFGLHEWAMVFEQSTSLRRHQQWPLRLGQDGTDQVVRDHQIKCSHFDAFRFFTPAARPRNALQPSLDRRLDNEQPGCLHASMDVYKWAYKLMPVVPSDLLVDCFELAKTIRAFDMRASPYDLSELGYQPVPIETPAGKAEYVAAQRGFAAAAGDLRRRLLATLTAVTDSSSSIEIGRPTAVFEEERAADHDHGPDQTDDGGDAV
ncbi:MAG: 3-methyladenine DNA glycosylase [Nakamurella sp.]